MRSVIAVIIVILSIIVAILISLIIKRRHDSISRMLIYSGIGLILSSFSGKFETVIAFLSEVFNIKNPVDSPTDFLQLAVGCLLVILGFVTRYRLNKRIYIMNMLGKMRKILSGTDGIPKLGLFEYQVKEILLDTVWAQDDISSLNQSTWNRAREQIIHYMKAFSAQDDGEKCFTGMAPIPFVIFAGVSSRGRKIERYFEYNRQQSNYCELERKRINYPSLKIPGIQNIAGSEVIVALSTTAEINNYDLVQFEGLPILIVKPSECCDNQIFNLYQLRNYVSEISNLLQAVSKVDGVRRIHLVSAIQSCLAFSLGEDLLHMENRITEVVSYHYNTSSEPKYPLGIVGNGSNVGELIKFNTEWK